jgi:4-oxalocrotonate tautomerase
MPVVRVSMLVGRTKEQKASLAKAITEAMATIANARADHVTVIFEEVPRENWSSGGKLEG